EDQIRGNTLLRRIGEPGEIGDFVHALVGEPGRWVTGQNIEASGGFLF
ncbi:MAG: 3-ketoacyl-ACP reductase, partial [Sphingomonadales bacterium]